MASIVSFFASLIARGWLVLDKTDSAFMVTAVNAAGMLPVLLLSLFSGVIADRVNRKLILIASDGFNLLVIMILALLVVTDVVQVWQVFALAVLHGVGFTLGMPARAATVSNLVSRRDLASGVALFTTIFSSAQLVGPAMAGFLINAFGNGSPFVASCLMLVIALAILLILKMPAAGPEEATPRVSVFSGIAQGLGYVRQDSTLIGLILLGMVFAVFIMPYQTLLPVFARDILHAGAGGLGWLGGLSGVGALTGSFTVASFSSPGQLRLLMVTGGISLGIIIILFALSTTFLLSLALILVVGFLFQIFMTSNMTLMQVISPNHVRGRVLSIRMVAVGLSPAGMLILGGGANLFGPAHATAIMGAIALVLVGSILLTIPSLRRSEADVNQVAAVPSEEHGLL